MRVKFTREMSRIKSLHDIKVTHNGIVVDVSPYHLLDPLNFTFNKLLFEHLTKIMQCEMRRNRGSGEIIVPQLSLIYSKDGSSTLNIEGKQWNRSREDYDYFMNETIELSKDDTKTFISLIMNENY